MVPAGVSIAWLGCAEWQARGYPILGFPAPFLFCALVAQRGLGSSHQAVVDLA